MLLEQSEPRRAADLVFDALATAEKAEGWVEVFVHGYRVATELSNIQYGFTEAMRQVERAMRFAEDRSLSRLAQEVALLQVELLTLDGRIDDAIRVVRRHQFSIASEPRLADEGWRERVRELIVLARLDIYQRFPTGFRQGRSPHGPHMAGDACVAPMMVPDTHEEGGSGANREWQRGVGSRIPVCVSRRIKAFYELQRHCCPCL